MSQTDNRLRFLLYRTLRGKHARPLLPLVFALSPVLSRLLAGPKVPSISVIEREYLSYFRDGLTNGGSVWTSIFVPTEILYAFGLHPLCLEGLAAMCASMGIADDFLGEYSARFVPNTMCTFHRLALDLGQSGLLPKPRLIVASSALCDGNVNTFRYLAEATGAPFFFLDIPQEDGPAGMAYLTSQLQELINFIEGVTGKALEPGRLDKTATDLQTSSKLLQSIYGKRCLLKRNLYYGHQMINFMLPLNTLAGSPRLVRICRAVLRDLDQEGLHNHAFPPEQSPDTIRIIWSHIAPAFQYNEIWPFIDDGQAAKIVMEECTRLPDNLFTGERHLEQIARRLINIPGNGPLEKRLQLIETIYREAEAHGIVHFCHWGCHQAAGAAPIMEKYFNDRGIPFLNINGDGVDARSCGLEQHKTRYRAFQESILQIRNR